MRISRKSRKHRFLVEPDTEPGTARSTTKSTAITEFMVGRSTDEVLGRAHMYFARRWPHAGGVVRKRASVEFSATIRTHYRRLFTEFFKIAALSLLTAGTYLFYWLLFQRSKFANHYHAEVFVRKDEDGTLVRIDAGTEEYKKRLEKWVIQELGGQQIDERPQESLSNFSKQGTKKPGRHVGRGDERRPG